MVTIAAHLAPGLGELGRAILGTLSWWKRETTKVTAELVQAGVVRIYAGLVVRPMIDELIRVASGLPKLAAAEQLSIIADRYRELSLYSDSRLRLTKEIAALLGFPLGQRSTVFVQPFLDGIEILSLEVRHQRLAQNLAGTTLPPLASEGLPG